MLQMHESAYKRLTEMGSPWAQVVQLAGQFWDDILSPEETT